MKKFFLLFSVIGVALLASCENEPPENEPDYSLAGFRCRQLLDSNYHEYFELAFTATTVDCIYSLDETIWSFTGEYTYFPPSIVIKDVDGKEYKGTVEETDNMFAMKL